MENHIRIATIHSLDYEKLKVRVWLEGHESAELDWPAEIGRNFKRWRPLAKNQQVVIACPSGDPSLAVIVGMLYSDAFPSPSKDPAIDLIKFNNGNFIEHSMKTNKFTIKGDIELIGTLRASVNVYAKNVSLFKHDHVKRPGRPTPP